ncbi:MAG TPA: hypothetical protein VFZ25_11695 [Chloroflexota bacterium]|nr:hypothetical protein [Chloroflexota bacterium]
MAESGHVHLAASSDSSRRDGQVGQTMRAAGGGAKSIARGPLLFDEFRLISRFGPEQQIQAIQQLQHSQGNGEVARAIARLDVSSAAVGLQRAPATASHPGAAGTESQDDYIDFMQGIDDLVTAASKGTGSGLGTVAFGNHLSDQHLGQLEELRTALMLVHEPRKDASRDALSLWESVKGQLWAELRRAPKIVHQGVRELDAMIGKDLNWIDSQYIRPAAYWEAHREALAHSDLQAPDLAAQQVLLDKEEKELEQAKELSEEAGKLASEGVAAAVLKDAKLGQEIFELVTMKGTIQEKLEIAKAKGIVEQTATAVELVSKIAGLKNTIIKTTFEILEGRAERLGKEAVEKGAEEVAKHWEALAKDYGGYAEKLKTVGTVIGIVGAAADGIRAFKAAVEGHWGEAATKAASAGMGILGALGPADAAPLLAAITIGAKIELAAMHMAAEFIRWCKDETVRDAAKSFVDTCVKVADWPAQDLVADANAWADPANADISDLITKRLQGYVPAMRKGLAAIGAEVQCGEPRCVGGHADLVQALGDDAKRVLLSPFAFPEDPLSMAMQIRDVFAGANALARYVRDHYPRDSEKAEEGEGEKG